MSLSRVTAPLLAALFGLVSASTASFANPLDAIDEDDREALEALAVYPEDVRSQALEVASEPALLIELQKLQSNSQDTFRDLLGPYSQDDQEQLFELSRYPDLVEEIASGGEKSRGELEKIASGYPEDVREAAVRQGGERHRVIARMHALLADFDGRFGRLIEEQPPRKQDAFRGMLRTPELLSLMTEHTNMTVLLGDAFERNPDELRDALSDLNLEVAKRNAEEADDWRSTVESDPDLKRDYDAAADDYQRDTGYSAYQGPSRSVVSVQINPYPFWVGYPWWYPVSYTYYDPWYWWYPRRAWGYCGYSYGPRVVLYGGPVWRPWYPSYHFTSWYFSSGHHHSRYPYLSDRFVSYYERPIVVNNYHYNGRKRVVRKFVYDTDHVMPAKYFGGKNRKDRVERFREFGKLAPQIEKVQKERRGKEFAKERGKRPGRDFDIRERQVENDAGRAEVRKLVAKNPKEFPELSKVKKEDWDRGPEKGGRGKDAGGLEIERDKGGKGKGAEGGKGKGAERGKAAPSFNEPEGGKGGKGKGLERDKSTAARPASEPEGGRRGKDKDSGKARPSLERPGGEKPKGGGSPSFDEPSGGKQQGDDRPSGGKGAKGGGGSKQKDDSARARPSFDAPDGADRARPKQERVREPEPKREKVYQAPRYEAPPEERSGGGRKRGGFEQNDAPRIQQQEAPRMEQSGGGGRKGGGGDDGGGGGGKNRKDKEEEEDAGGAGGGGGGGRGKRGR